MNATGDSPGKTTQDNAGLELAFDVGHSSIGWAVLQAPPSAAPALPTLLGCGVVTFGADDCLASKRRDYRRQRRHARATRQRIARMEKLLAHLGVLPAEELQSRHDQAGGDSFAWQHAANILSAARDGTPLPALGWSELWDILRWYAHNRGYFAPPWANRGEESAADDKDDVPDTEKVEKANAIMRELKTSTMAETIAAYTSWYEGQAARWQQKLRSEKPAHFKGLKAAFLRETVVWPEVRDLLNALKGRLPKLDDAFIRALLGNDPDPMKDREAWRTISCPAIQLPNRYQGGLLFGQVIPRFDNRIIGVCPIYFAMRQAELVAAGFSPTDASDKAAKQAKLPSKASREFLRFRWAMQLANIFGSCLGERQTRPLTAEERQRLTAIAERQGAFTKADFKKAVRETAGWPAKPPRDNLDGMLMLPDGEQALVLDPARREISNHKLAAAFDALPERFRKRLYGKLLRGKTVTPVAVRRWLDGAEAAMFDAEIERVLAAANTRRSKKQEPPTHEELLREELRVDWNRVVSGRAPYARPVLQQACEEVMRGWDPRAENSERQPRGCLCQTNELKEAQLRRRLEEQTNNHLIRHRLLILERLLRDLIAAPEFANGDKSRIAKMTIEVNRDLRDLSGKTRKEQEQDLGLRLGDFKRVAAKVEGACERRGIRVTAGLIRKARVAEDLGWRCPYTGKDYCIDTLLDGDMDKEHIIPHTDRQSDSLDSLVITWNEVNKWKGKRTAMQFIREEGGKPVPGRPELSIMSPAVFQKHIGSLDVRKGHDDDRARKKRRIRRLLTENYEEKEFTPRDLTVTSHLVRLGAQVLQRSFPKDQRPPVNSIPGSVTGEVRKAWKLTGCLEAANPAIMEEVEERDPNTGELNKVRRAKKKDDIRGITHMHHALDACVLALAAHYFPRHGTVWSAMVKAGTDRDADEDRRLWLAMTKRRPTPAEAALLKTTGLYQQDSEGRWHLDDLPEPLKQQLRQRLAEKRVVQHIPADMTGLGKRIRQNTTGILKVLSPSGAVLWDKESNSDADLEAVRNEVARAKDSKDYRLELTAPVGEDDGDGESSNKARKPVIKAASHVLGFLPPSGKGKLTVQRGVRELRDNFGVAILDHAPEGEEKFVIIPWHKVYVRIHKGFPARDGRPEERSLVARNGGHPPRILRNGQLIRVPKGTHQGTWRVFSAKNNADGIALALGKPDAIVYDKAKQNVKLRQLIKDGMVALRTSFTGAAACPTTSSA